MEQSVNLPARIRDKELFELRRDSTLEVLGQIGMGYETEQVFNDIQLKALDELSQNLAADQIVDIPTRTGKSYLIREIASCSAESNLRVLILSHRNHILREHIDELKTKGIDDIGQLFDDNETASQIDIGTFNKIARADKHDTSTSENYDLILLDEAHRALGPQTAKHIAELFPDALRISFTATPDYAENRSTTDIYGEKIASTSIVEAIKMGVVSPVRAIVYETDATIDSLDPEWHDFSPRELKKIAQMASRNMAIVDMAEDLVNDDRRGLISTVPGEDLLHADDLKTLLEQRGLRAEVVRGGEDAKTGRTLKSFEDGDVDILLYCNLLREGYSSNVASFHINGSPTTSIVNRTQDLGRVLQLKDREAVAIDFIDNSLGKKQRTLLEVLEMDRAVQGVLVGPHAEASDSHESRDTYLRGLFRSRVYDSLKDTNRKTVSELLYPSRGQADNNAEKALLYELGLTKELIRERKKWNKILQEEGLDEEQADYLGLSADMVSRLAPVRSPDEPDEPYGVPVSIEYRHPPRLRRSATDIVSRIYLPVEPVADIPDTDQRTTPNYEPSAEQETVRNLTNGMLVDLLNSRLSNDLEVQVIKMRFGLIGDGPLSLEAVGDTFGVTKERIRQIQAKTLQKLRITHGAGEFALLFDEDRSHDYLIPDEKKQERPLAVTRPKSQLGPKTKPKVDRYKAQQILRERDEYTDYIDNEYTEIQSLSTVHNFGFKGYYAADGMTAVSKLISFIARGDKEHPSFRQMLVVAKNLRPILEAYPFDQTGIEMPHYYNNTNWTEFEAANIKLRNEIVQIYKDTKHNS